MNLWIDDTRDEPEGWAVARTYADAYLMLGQYEYDVASFDHDLGDEIGVETGYRLLCAIERGEVQRPKEMRVHSMNPVGRQRMLAVIERLRGSSDGGSNGP